MRVKLIPRQQFPVQVSCTGRFPRLSCGSGCRWAVTLQGSCHGDCWQGMAALWIGSFLEIATAPFRFQTNAHVHPRTHPIPHNASRPPTQTPAGHPIPLPPPRTTPTGIHTLGKKVTEMLRFAYQILWKNRRSLKCCTLLIKLYEKHITYNL